MLGKISFARVLLFYKNYDCIYNTLRFAKVDLSQKISIKNKLH